MKLDPDCTRAILMAVEDTCDPSHKFRSDLHSDRIAGGFAPAVLYYHACQCDLSGFFVGFSKTVGGSWEVKDLTPKAHEFLANIRSDTVWNHVKSVASTVGSRSIMALTQIASAVVTEIIKAQLGLSSGPFVPMK